MIYEKDGDFVQVAEQFVYEDSIYKVFKEGIALWETHYYSSSKPIKLKKKDYINRKKKSDEYFIRFFTLEFAPESYLINNGFSKYE